MSKRNLDRAFFETVTGKPAPPPPIWARIAGGAIGIGILALGATLIAWPIAAIWRFILGG